MRKVTKEAISAFMNHQKKSFGATKVDVFTTPETGKNVMLYLHGNLIAMIQNGKLSITHAGWKTNTTKERLNGIPGVSISQKAGVWYLNGVAWDGNWITIKQ